MVNLKQYFSDESWEYDVESNNLEEALNLIGSVSTDLDVCSPLKKSRKNQSNKNKHLYDEDAHILKLRFLEAEVSYRCV